jgi:hypothetical protein
MNEEKLFNKTIENFNTKHTQLEMEGLLDLLCKSFKGIVKNEI